MFGTLYYGERELAGANPSFDRYSLDMSEQKLWISCTRFRLKIWEASS